MSDHAMDASAKNTEVVAVRDLGPEEKKEIYVCVKGANMGGGKVMD